jgi:hypothetical protein
LRRLANTVTYLHTEGTRFWCSTQPSLKWFADDRAAQFDVHDVLEETTCLHIAWSSIHNDRNLIGAKSLPHPAERIQSFFQLPTTRYAFMNVY